MTAKLQHPLKSMVSDIWHIALRIPAYLESLLAQGREHIQERSGWAQERRNLLRSIEAQAATINVLLARCESLERDNENSMSLLGWRSRGVGLGNRRTQ